MADDYKDYGYESLDPGNGESGRLLADKIISVVQHHTGIKTICDLGCGNGYISSRLAGLGYTVTGVDASQTGIELARKNHTSENLSFICARIDEELVNTLSDRQFDLVLSSDVIEHLYRPSDLIEVASAILKPTGYLLVGTPFHGYVKNLILSLLNKWDDHHTVDWEGGHIKFFSVKTLSYLLAQHTYKIISFHYYGRAPLLWKNMICLAQKAA